MKKRIVCVLLGVIMTIGMIFSFSACENDSKDSAYQEKIQQQSQDMVGYPNIVNLFEKKTLKEIYELRDQADLVCYYYTQNQMDGKFVYMGQCIGFGIPYGTQYTNPESLQRTGTGNWEVLPQADPNSLYSTGDTHATWMIYIDESGNQQIAYMEPDTVVRQTKLPAYKCEAWSLPSDY